MFEMHQMQYKRIVMLTSCALTFAAFAIWRIFQSVAERGGILGNPDVGADLYLLSCTVLMTCGVVAILARSYEDHKQITQAERFDQDTGLPNSASLIDRLTKTAKNGKLPDGVTLLAIGIDGLQSINVARGYGVGNQVIRAVAERLSTAIGGNTVLYRISGDTFVVSANGIDNESDLTRLAERIIALQDEPILAGGFTCFVGFAVGAVLAGDETSEIDGFVRRAELALLHTRTQSSEKFVIYSDSLENTTKRLSDLETGFRQALETDQLEVYFQPLIDGSTKEVVSVEALARWRHPQLGVISPQEFVRLAEALGLNEKLGNVVLRKACSAIGPIYGLKLAVNISANHLLHPEFVNDLKQILALTNFPADRLEIEITENVVIDLPVRANEVLRNIRKMGISVALDDFGTGYTGLSYLKELQVDRIKIDAKFVAGLGKSEEAEAMFASIVEIIKQRGHKITVEGIETMDQLEFLEGFDGFLYQGFLFSKPLQYVQLLRSDLLKSVGVEQEDHVSDEKAGAKLKLVASS
ncbi:MAG: putative bifunctional diguanylate cyclase/phosphodiesterase [Rhizobiaceae bacterium]